ncbi:MAG TPA: TfoX/Sxy family protein [Anaerolineales bacterium]|nr:TfoX/Sxy family protein [Anaerolineales bacterium]
MSTSASYLAYVTDLLAPLVALRTKRMFGGVGIYAGEFFFALIDSGDTLYFKVDGENIALFAGRGLRTFMNSNYYEAPAEVLEDPQLLREYTERSVAAAQRAAANKPRPKRRPLPKQDT